MRRWIYIIHHWRALVRVAYDLFEHVDRFGGFHNSEGDFNGAANDAGHDPEIAAHWEKFWELREKLAKLEWGAR